ncbi:MAG: MurT ligase domain-containing protein [Coriobacteriales bacterium]|nr:MurT ligase domain-containing protein [Coriobacteriales bacterium]
MLALWLAKAVAVALRCLGRKATQLPGRIAITLCPEFLKCLDRPKTVIAVTGTNGKTTVCNLLVDVMEQCGLEVISNRYGSNLNSGIASALLANCGPLGTIRVPIAVLEVDERSSRLVYPLIEPDFLVCTNLFRDSIARNAHTEFISYVIESALPAKTRLILNADDLISSMLGSQEGWRSWGDHEQSGWESRNGRRGWGDQGDHEQDEQGGWESRDGREQDEQGGRGGQGRRRTYFGVGPWEGDRRERMSLTRDITICPHCNTPLEYEYVHYHHIGKAFCPQCGFCSPPSDYLVANINTAERVFTVQTDEGSFPYRLISASIFNVYNLCATIAVLHEYGISHARLQQAFEKVELAQSRYHEEVVGDVTLVMHLAKGQNAIACSRAFDYIASLDGRKAVILNLDDFFDAKGGSENITWLYDCDYERLDDPNITQLVIGGIRSYDHYLRLLIAGVAREKIRRTRYEHDTAALVELAEVDKVFILYDVYTIARAEEVLRRLRARLTATTTAQPTAGAAGVAEVTGASGKAGAPTAEAAGAASEAAGSSAEGASGSSGKAAT